MALYYVKPKNVTSPMDYVQEVTPIFDGTEKNEGKEKSKRLEDFSLAILKWQDEYTLGIRWNLTMREDKDPKKQSGQKQCKGMPFSSAHPIWFVLPKQLHESVLIAMKSFLQDADLEQIRKKLNIIL